jgi:hypothetical protein
MKAADAMPLARLSAEMTHTSACTSCPTPLSQTNSKLVSALSAAPSMSTRMTPSRAANKPPTNAPTKVMMTPYSLVTLATSLLVNPMST